MAEWPNAPVLKTGVGLSHRGFKSLSLRPWVRSPKAETGDLKSLQCGFESHRTYQPDIAQFGSAPALGAGGRRFKSCYPDSTTKGNNEKAVQ